MFNNRTITVGLSKKRAVAPTDTSVETETFEKKMDTVRLHLGDLGAKMFLGVCVYVLLDTRRQVAIERAKIPQTD